MHRDSLISSTQLRPWDVDEKASAHVIKASASCEGSRKPSEPVASRKALRLPPPSSFSLNKLSVTNGGFPLSETAGEVEMKNGAISNLLRPLLTVRVRTL